MLIDTHAHLSDPLYQGAEEIVNSMRADGVEKIVTVGYDLRSSLAGMALADRYEGVYFTCGVHPSDADSLTDEAFGKLLELTRHPKCVAVGEIGLDYHYEDTDKEVQAAALLRQLELVKACGLPAIFHVRDAYGDFDALVRPRLDMLKSGAVLHCFSGSKEFAEQYVKEGFYVSFTGAITFKNNRKAADVVPVVPRDRLMVETDCPYLTPEPYRGKPNYPAYVRYVAEKAAALRGETFETLSRYTTENAYRFYSKMRR